MKKEKNNLFTPLKINGLTIKNRVVMPPMDQYISDDGFVTDWHELHYTTRAVGGAGLIIVESSAVSGYESMISDEDLALWDDKFIDGMARIARGCHKHGAKIGIQLNHAGRKCESKKTDVIFAPSPIAFSEDYRTPKELSQEDMDKIKKDFANAALRAVKAGFDLIEIHAAHGYLLSQFLCPLSNTRTDIYGKERGKFTEEVIMEIRSAIGKDFPLILRVSASDWHEKGNTPEDMIKMIKPMERLIDALDISSGGTVNDAKITAYCGYQIQFASAFKKVFNIPVIGGGLLWDPFTVNEIIKNNAADAVYIGRELLRNPYWALQASRTLGIETEFPAPYIRARR